MFPVHSLVRIYITIMDYTALRTKLYDSLLDLVTEDGINASGRDEIYGCIFGRDSAITILKILKITRSLEGSSYYEVATLNDICKRSLLHLTTLQGKKTVHESGEEPGKFIHEYRKDKFDHLLRLEKPWYVYPDGILRNYDSLDSTPLALIALYTYWKQTRDDAFLLSVLPAVEQGLNWIITYGDRDKDYLVEYELPKDRLYGGLSVQSWTDSHNTFTGQNGRMPEYPIAPVEVQGYAWLALRLWSDFYRQENIGYARTEQFSQKLAHFAQSMKKAFNSHFLFQDRGYTYAAQALDGSKTKIKTITGNPLLLLWATYSSEQGKEAIVDSAVIASLVDRAFLPDMFDPDGGIRTMSTLSPLYNPSSTSYHNGSFWPKLNGMSHEGLLYWGFEEKAQALKEATLKAVSYFGSPIELYMRGEDGSYQEFLGPDGQMGCRIQAWSAASVLDLLTE